MRVALVSVYLLSTANVETNVHVEKDIDGDVFDDQVSKQHNVQQCVVMPKWHSFVENHLRV